MKKLAYTLTEVLITLGIIGVVAAIAAPAIFNAKPDANKTMYLRLYDNLTKITQDIAGNSQLFLPLSTNVATQGDGNLRDVSHVPLTDLSNPIDSAFSGCSGHTKFACILENVLGGTNAHDEGNVGNGRSFDYENKRWRIDYQSSNVGSDNGLYYIIRVDTIPGNANEHNGDDMATYANFPRNFDTYVFWVTPSGTVLPADLPGQMYVETRMSTNQRGSLNKLIEEGVRSGKYVDPDIDAKYRESIRLKDTDFPEVR